MLTGVVEVGAPAIMHTRAAKMRQDVDGFQSCLPTFGVNRVVFCKLKLSQGA